MLENAQKQQTIYSTKQQKKDKLHSLAMETDSPLFTLKSVFPFDLFPDEIAISRSSVLIKKGLFFFSDKMFPVVYSDMQMVTVTTNLLFGKISFQLLAASNDIPTVNFLPKAEAIRAGHIITGLITCHKEGLDLSQFTTDEIVQELEQIGQTKDVG